MIEEKEEEEDEDEEGQLCGEWNKRRFPERSFTSSPRANARQWV